MRVAGFLGVVLIVLGAIVLVMKGVSYVKDRDEVRLGPVHVATEKRGYVPPAVGLVAVIVGAGLLFVPRRS